MNEKDKKRNEAPCGASLYSSCSPYSFHLSVSILDILKNNVISKRNPGSQDSGASLYCSRLSRPHGTSFASITKSTTSSEFTKNQTPSSAPASAPSDEGRGSGFTLSDKIALGMRIGIGVPILIATIATCFEFGRHRDAH
jgi:hypothetical protein